MTKITNFLWVCALVIVTFTKLSAQLSGTYNVPANYSTLAAALSALNSQGVSGPVIIEVNAGHTETAPAGGFALTATGTTINTITFKKTGTGANPLLTAHVGVNTPASAVQDGVWRFVGSDYITIDGIDLIDANTSNPATMEYGFGFFKAGVTDGCQNNTVKNCAIDLKVLNNATATAPATEGSRGINLVNSLAASQTSILTPSSFAGTNSNNKFYSNTITNCNIGVALIGYAAPSPFTLADTGNDVGGTSGATGNTIVNFGGGAGATNPAAGIRTLAQYDLNVSFNILNNNTGSGTNHPVAIRGIYTNLATSASQAITNNTITLNSSAAAVQMMAIENAAGATAANNTITISNNLITNSSNTSNTTGAFYGIYNNAASCAYLNIGGNKFSGVNTAASTGNNYLIYNTGAVTNSISILANQLENCRNASSGAGVYYQIFNNVVSTAVLNISANAFTTNTVTASTGNVYMIYNASATSNSILMNNNTSSACTHTLSSSGIYYGIFNNGASTANLEIKQNTFNYHRVVTAAGTNFQIYNTAAITNSIVMSNNVFSNCTNSITSTGSYFGIYNNAASSGYLDVSSNTFSANLVSASNGTVYAVFNRGVASTTFGSASLNNNSIATCTYIASSNAPYSGIYNSGVTSGNLSLSGNTITATTWLMATSLKYMIYNTGAVSSVLNLNNNLLSDLTSTNNTTGTFNGINNAGTCTVALTINNNNFSNIKNTASTGGTYLMLNSGALPGGVITITNNAISGFTNVASGLGDFYAVSNSGTTFSSLDITNNSLSNTFINSFTGVVGLLYNTGAVTTSITSINVSNNIFANITGSINSSGSFFGIYNNASSCQNLNLNANTFTNIATYATNGANHMIYNRGTLTNTFSSVSLNANLISNCYNAASAAASFYSIWNNGVTSTLTSISNNTITSSIWASATSTRYMVSNFGPALSSANISGNLISNCSYTNNTTAALYHIYNNNNSSVSSGPLAISNNTITNVRSVATSGETHLINNSGLITNTFTSVSLTNNVFSNYSTTVTGTGAFFGLYNNTASAIDLNISQNTFTSSALNSLTGASYFIYNRGVAANLFSSVTASNNVLAGITLSATSTGAFYGIVNAGVATSSCSLLSIRSNSFMNSVLSSTSNGIVLINNTCPVTTSIAISTNSFVNLSNTLTATGTFYAISNNGNSSAGDLSITNNSFLNLISSATTGNRFLVYNNGGIGNSLSLSSNFISNCSHSLTAGGSYYGVYNNSAGSGLSADLSYNVFTNNYSSSLAGSTNLILNAGVVTTTLANVTILNNSIDSYTSVATSGAFNAINTTGFTSANLSLLSNTISNISVSSPGGAQQLILNTGKITNSISINNNLVNAYTNTLNATGAFAGLSNLASYANSNFPQALDILNNRFSNVSLNSTTGNIYFVNSSGVASNTIAAISISGNLVSNFNPTLSTSGVFYGINNSAISAGSLSVNNNSFTSGAISSTLSTRYLIANAGIITGNADLSHNVLSNISSTLNTTTGSFFGIINSGTVLGNLSLTSNTVQNHQLSTTNVVTQLLYNSGTVSNSITIADNFVSGISHTATTGSFFGIFNNAGSSANLNVSANTFTNIINNSTSGSLYLVYNNRSPATATVTNISLSTNYLGAITFSSATGAFFGVHNNNMSFATLSVASNSLVNVVTTSTNGIRYFVYNTGTGSLLTSITNNLSSGFTSTSNAAANFFCVYNAGSQLGDLSVNGNSFLNHNLTSTSGSAYISYNTGSVTGVVSMDNNLVSGFTHSSTAGGSFFGIYNNAGNSANLSISSNTLNNTNLNTTTGSTQYITSRGVNASVAINTISILNNVLGTASFSASSGAFYGILNTQTSFTNLNVTGNTFSNFTSSTTTSPRYFIYNTGLSYLNLIITSNQVLNYTAALNTTGVFYNALNTGSVSGNLTISGNTFSSQVLPSSTAASYMIQNSALVTGSVIINNNIFSAISHTSTTGVLYGVYQNAASASTLSVNNNTITNIATTNSTSIKYLIYTTTPAANAIQLNTNFISGYSAPFNTTGTFAGIYNTGFSQGSFEANNNTVSNILLPATTGSCYAIFTNGTVTTTSSLNNNLVSDLTYTASATGGFYGVYNLASAVSLLSMSGNTISASSVSTPTAAAYMVYTTGSPTLSIPSLSMNNNVVSSFTTTTGSGAFYGIYNAGILSNSLSMSGNINTNCLSTSTASARYLVYNTGSVTGSMSFNNNQVGNYRSPINTTANFYGIYNSADCTGSLDMNANFVTGNALESTSGTHYLIYNSGAISSGISLNTNTVSNNTNATTTSTGDFYAIYNSGASPANLSMDLNAVTSNSSSAASANTYLIHNTGAITNAISMSSNRLGQFFTNASVDYSGAFNNIFNAGGAPTTTLSITNNTFTGYSYTGLAGSGNIYFINNSNNNARYDIGNNLWTSISMNHNGSEYLMYNPSNTSSQLNVTNNTAINYTRTATAAAMYLYYSNGNSPSTCSQIFSGNTFSNIVAGTQGTGSFYGIYTMDGTGTTYPKKQAFNNVISNITYNALGFFYGYYFDFLGDASGSGSAVFNNTLSSVSWAGPFYGMYIGGNVSSNLAANVFSNTVSHLSITAVTADMHGAYLLGGGSGLNFYKNKIGDLSASGAQGKANGIRVNTAVNTLLYNNLIGNIFTPSTTLGDALKGLNIAGGSNVKVLYNTVYLNATSTGSLFGSAALYANSTVSLELRNNILINTSTPVGLGQAIAYWRSSNSLSGYLNTSNNNIFYAGIPSSSKLLYFDGTNACQTLPAYQATVSPRDNVSASESTPFLSTVVTNTNFLHVDSTVPSLTESGAVNISGVNDDADSEIRQGNSGYIGTGTAPDIGADEYQQNLIPCSGANAGTISVPTSTINCAGQTIYLLSTGYTAAGDITHQWKVSSTSGGPYSNVSGGIGANTTAYTTGTLTAGTYYYVLVTTCNNGNITGTSNQLTVVVNAGPTASASVSSATVCSGLDLIFAGSSNIGVNYYWAGPNNFTSTVQNPTLTNVITNSGGTYTFLASDANCTSTPAFVNVTVYPTPPAFSLVPPSSSICIGNSQTITASIPITSPTLNFGSQTNQNPASGYPAPYSVYYGGQKMQILILASELATAGFTTGTPIQSVQFPVASLGGNWNSSLFSCQNFMVGMKSTTTSVLSVFETGISNVVPSTNFTPSVGYANSHIFSAPFIWDGTSNLILETVFSNSIIGTSGNTVIQYNSPTGFQSTLVYRADNQSVPAIAAATTSNANIGFVRPDFKLNGTQVGTYSWSPSNSLSSSSGVSVVASPTATSIYSVELSDGQCISSTTVSIDVIENPTLTISTTASVVCLGNAATLTAMGANQYTWSSGIMQPSIAVSPFVSTTYTVFGSNPVCPPTSTTILISTAPALTLTSQVIPPVICLGGSSTLNVSGASNYTWTGGENTNSISVTPNVTTNYSVIAYNGPGCWTTKILSVKVNPLPVITVTPSGATICSGESVVFEAGGVYSFTWTPLASNSPIYEVSPAISTSYTVVGSDQNNCLNTAVVDVSVNPCTGIASNKSSAYNISVFPNPSSGMVTVEFGFDGEKDLRVESSVGALISEKTTLSQTEKIDLTGYAKGIYFVKVKTKDQIANYKILVE